MRVRNTKDDCVAVWRCAGDAACADATARTTHVLDDNWLPKRSPHGLGQHARNYIGGAVVLLLLLVATDKLAPARQAVRMAPQRRRQSDERIVADSSRPPAAMSWRLWSGLSR